MDPELYMICAFMAFGGWPLVLARFLFAEEAVSRPMEASEHFVHWLFSLLFALTWPVTIPLGILLAYLYWASLAPGSE